MEGQTGADGLISFDYGWFFTPAALIVVPAGNFWSMLIRGPKDPITVDCPRLPADGPLAWWHEAMGEKTYNARAGEGIRVGVADTGIGPHPCLKHVHAIGSFIDGNFDPARGLDVDSHAGKPRGCSGTPSAHLMTQLNMGKLVVNQDRRHEAVLTLQQMALNLLSTGLVFGPLPIL